MKVRTRSLFWTFASVFLVVVVVATVLQVIVSVAVLRPLATRGAREQAEATIDRVSRDIAELPDQAVVPDVIEVLHANATRERGELLVFCARNGRVLHDRRVAPEAHRGVVAVLAAAGLADSAADARMRPLGGPDGPPGAGGGPPPFGGPLGDGPGGGRPPGDLGDEPPPWSADGPPLAFEEPPAPASSDSAVDGRQLLAFDGPPPAADTRGPQLPAERFELLAHQAVVRGGRALGELAVVGPASGANLWSLPESRGVLLILPFAVIVSGGAGLFLVRLLARRLNALERVTDRITGGVLPTADDDRGRDEIERLEDRFNRMADRVVAARTGLEETDRQRRRLLADISHELATPLTSIRGYVETLLDPGVTTTVEERKGYLEDVLAESKRLEAMINELFDLARLEAGATPLQRVRLDWAELCRNTARRLEPRFRAAGLTLAWMGEPEPVWLHADGRRLEEVAENLLANAIRYVPSGGTVTLSMERATTTSGKRLRFTVADDGPGIPEADLPHVFERFYRAESVRATGGTGLGLAIVNEIVRQHGGEVRAQRRDPRGAEFVVELPADEDV